ncbi:stalk domain-containing protein [Gorillibacterium timonense]|uniref:stalk domain-containing protein n=1 Tax=Gorillibacterium timonense TaxID=1689269 RepID=UPI00071D28D1|nr:stalk domain-containing protein [Gorillibacterium timonense]
MKPSWQKTMLALTVGGVSITGMVLPATAATKPVVSEVKVNVDGQQAGIRTIQAGSVRLVSVRDLSGSFGIVPEYSAGNIILNTENTVELKVGSLAYTVNGETKQFVTAPFEAGGTVFVELNSLVEALGGSVEANGQETLIHSFQLQEGDFISARWIGENRILAVRDDDKAVFLIDAQTKRSTLLVVDEDAAGMVISPDGKTGVYTLPSGAVKTINLQNGKIKTISTDNTVKTDLVWSADGSTVYFIQGDNQEKLASVKLETGAITKLLEDKVNYKSNLRVSADSKTLLYIVNVTGVAKNDSDSTEESLTIDYSVAGTQLASLALDKKDAKPVILAAGNTNKLYPQLLKDGSAAFISIDPTAQEPVGSLQLVAAADKVTSALSELDAEETVLTAAGDLLVAGLNKSGQFELIQVQADGSKKAVASYSAELTGLALSASGQTVGIEAGKVVLATSAGLTYLTR